jgi:hypothetical protein
MGFVRAQRRRLGRSEEDRDELDGVAGTEINADCIVGNPQVKPVPQGFLDPFQTALASVWNSLKVRLFLLHPVAGFTIQEFASPMGLPFP